MLSRNHDSINTLHFSRSRIFNRNLRLPIRPKIRTSTILTNFRKLLTKLLRQRNRQRHQFRRLITSKPKHHSLVAGAAGVYAHGDVAGLFIDAGDYGAGVGVEAVDSVVVADGLDYSADDGLKIYVGFGGDFAGDYYQAGAGEGFAGDAAGGIFTQAGVENG